MGNGGNSNSIRCMVWKADCADYKENFLFSANGFQQMICSGIVQNLIYIILGYKENWR